MTAWSDLPNAVHIDRVLESVKKHPLIWDAALNAAWGAARAAARAAARVAARVAASDAILALIAWDDSAEFLDMTSDELEVWARLSSNPGAILLLPAVNAFEQIAILETV